ncbi:MAG: hypothetical protein MJ069_10705 [Salinivirgaceae bacterium]|nr:hypothetical protein [Salinivirgaceae bacterium]
MRKQILAIAVATLTMLTACNSDKVKLSGKVQQNTCAEKNNVSYTFYQPAKASGNLPIIIFFDSHCDGKTPVENYAPLADKYGYMLMGSNDLHNGLSAGSVGDIVAALLNEATKQLNADPNRIYLAGFSGGAKLATLYGVGNPVISGVVACGAGSIPQVEPDSTFCFVGMVGDKDFNYLEMKQTIAAFSQFDIDYSLVVFSGKHQWPSTEDFEKAIEPIEVNAMRYGKKDVDQNWLQNLYDTQCNAITDALAAGDQIAAAELVNRTESMFGSLMSDNGMASYVTALYADPKYAQQLRQIQNLATKEIQLRSKFISSFDTRDLDWWRTEIENFNKSINSTDLQVSLTSHRLKAYLSMAAFSLASNNIMNEEAEKAEKKIAVYEIVDPNNSDVYLMKARYNLLVNNRTDMVANYQKAVQMGFKQAKQYAAEALWAPLFNQPEIQKLLK